jgi:PAS domain S-box-containing protein
MTWIEVVWPMMSAASLTLAWIHLVIWIKRRDQRVHLLFALAAASVAGIALLELMELRATTTETFATAIRWAHPLLAIFFVAVIGIVRIQFDAGRRWLAWTVAGMRVLALLPNFFAGANLNFRSVLALEFIEIWGSGPLAAGVVEPNPWMWMGQLSNLLMIVFLADAIATVWRRGDPRQRRAALLVAGSFAVALLVAGSITGAVALGWLRLPLTFNPMFLPALLAMSYQLGSDVVRAGILGERLSRNEAELRASEARFRLVVEAAPAGMLMVAADGCIAMANAEVERLFRHTREELLGMRFADLVPTIDGDPVHDASMQATHSAASRSAGLRRECAGRRKDGSDVAIELGFSPVDAAAGGVLLVTINDIGERLRRERESAQHRAEITHLSRVATIGELTGSLAHEITQPLTAIMSNVQAALGLVAAGMHGAPDLRVCLEAILASDRRAIEVIRRLRRMLKNEAGEFQDLDLNELVQDTLQLARNDLLNRGVRVKTDLAPGLPSIRGDRIQLQQVLLNLLLNGCDATQDLPDEPRLCVQTRENAAGFIDLAVEDNGPGIAPDQLERIFEPFVTSRREGLGLGLAVTRTIVSLHQGVIGARNRSEGGASFVVSLPRDKSSNSPATALPLDRLPAIDTFNRT